jgi:NAD(P)-dependent dehydrogenase (short-subunit alcohol dehydrogenase family)
MNKLENKVVLVTGSGRGLGRAIALELCKAGAVVYVTDIKIVDAEESVAIIKKDLPAEQQRNVFSVALDVREEKMAEEVIKSIVEIQGKIDILINNAGVNVTATVEDLSVAEWDRTVSTILRGAYVMSHTVFPVMKKQGGGNIINIVSSLAKRVKENSPAYVASKWGLQGLSQLLYMQGRKYGIKVTALSPAGMRTSLLLDRFPNLDQSKIMDPAEVAKVVRFVLELPEEIAIPDLFMMSTKEETWP